MALRKFNREEEEDKLIQFILHMSDEEEIFIPNAQRQGYRLDENQSMDSLEELERYIHEQKVSFEDPSNEALLERMNCWYYLGEVVRKNYGGYWRFSMNEENTGNWGAYVIDGHCSVPGVEFEPRGLVSVFIGKGCKPGFFRRAIEVV